jgi:hypothetical protein
MRNKAHTKALPIFLWQHLVNPNQVINTLLPPAISSPVPTSTPVSYCHSMCGTAPFLPWIPSHRNEGQACMVTYSYRAAQAMALAAPSSKTPFDPRSINLPNMAVLVGFYDVCLCFPIKQTWLEAIKAGNCDSFDGLTYSNMARYCPDAYKTIMGHLAQLCQNICSTRPCATAVQTPHLPPNTSATEVSPSSKVMVCVYPISKLYTDNTGRFPVKARSGNQYVMIVYHADGNLIFQKTFKNWSNTYQISAYNNS